jgi:WD40 repeat protein
MRAFLVQKLCNGNRYSIYSKQKLFLYQKMILVSTDLLRYSHMIYDPLRINARPYYFPWNECPIGCCWSPKFGKLIVVTFDKIFFFDENAMQFELVFERPFFNFYGLDVDSDGRIVVAGYQSREIYLFSPTGELISQINYPIAPGNIHITFSSVCFSSDSSKILLFSSEGIYALDIKTSRIICIFGTKGSRLKDVRGEGQISRYIFKNMPSFKDEDMYVISVSDNNLVKFVKIDWSTNTMEILAKFGTDFFFRPLGIIPKPNCLFAVSIGDGCAYISDGKNDYQILNGEFSGGRLACALPNGRMVVCCQGGSCLKFIEESWSIPPPSTEKNRLTNEPLLGFILLSRV